MNRRAIKDPSYRLHKQSGQAIVTLPDGFGGRKDILLGAYDSKESLALYYRIIAEWRANGRRLGSPDPKGPSIIVNELILAYWRFVEGYYVKDGRPTSEQDTIRQAMRFVKQFYGELPAKNFGPLALKAVREEMILKGWARRHINKQVGRIKRMFAWAVEEELLPVEIYQTLEQVKGLKKGKSAAREKPRVKPVPGAYVETVLPLVPATVRTMIEVQLLCGGRPQDVVQMRAIDIDMTGPVWEYRPPRYKTEHHNEDDSPDRERIIFIGPKAQALLKPYLSLNVTDYLFSPKRNEERRNAERRENRQTKLWPSHMRHQQKKRKGRRRPFLHDRYDVPAYRRAIRRACIAAGVPVWAPNQLRHARGTEIRKRYGLEASQAVLGHSELGVTQVYAEVDHAMARKVMAEIG